MGKQQRDEAEITVAKMLYQGFFPKTGRIRFRTAFGYFFRKK
jgi:hypothetical protein